MISVDVVYSNNISSAPRVGREGKYTSISCFTSKRQKDITSKKYSRKRPVADLDTSVNIFQSLAKTIFNQLNSEFKRMKCADANNKA